MADKLKEYSWLVRKLIDKFGSTNIKAYEFDGGAGAAVIISNGKRKESDIVRVPLTLLDAKISFDINAIAKGIGYAEFAEQVITDIEKKLKVGSPFSNMTEKERQKYKDTGILPQKIRESDRWGKPKEYRSLVN